MGDGDSGGDDERCQKRTSKRKETEIHGWRLRKGNEALQVFRGAMRYTRRPRHSRLGLWSPKRYYESKTHSKYLGLLVDRSDPIKFQSKRT
jgi:hypothetical protein